jgi:hypothetical protein
MLFLMKSFISVVKYSNGKPEFSRKIKMSKEIAAGFLVWVR